jgi:hypothetical protein
LGFQPVEVREGCSQLGERLRGIDKLPKKLFACFDAAKD